MLKIADRPVEMDLAALVKPREPSRGARSSEFAADLDRQTAAVDQRELLPARAADRAQTRGDARDPAPVRGAGRDVAEARRADRADEALARRDDAATDRAAPPARSDEADAPATADASSAEASEPASPSSQESSEATGSATDDSAGNGQQGQDEQAAANAALALLLATQADTTGEATPIAQAAPQTVPATLVEPDQAAAATAPLSTANAAAPAAPVPAAAQTAATDTIPATTNADATTTSTPGTGVTAMITSPGSTGEVAEPGAPAVPANGKGHANAPGLAAAAAAKEGSAETAIGEADKGDANRASEAVPARGQAAEKLAALELPGLARGLETAQSTKGLSGGGDIVLPTTVEGSRPQASTAGPHGTATAPGQAPVREAVPVERVGIELAAALRAGTREIEIRLDPAELGRIDVTLDVDDAGKVTTRLVVERSETLDQLRRDAPSLERALQEAGLKTDSGSLQFSLRDQGQNGRDGDGTGQGRRTKVTVEVDDINAWRPAERARMAALRGGVDVRI